MSLLLEALKKAEKAKQEQSGRHTGAELGPGAPRNLIPEEGTAGREAEAPLRTGPSSPGLRLDLEEHLPPPSALKPRMLAAEAGEKERRGAEALFAAKQPESRRSPVIGLIAVLLLGLIAGAAYIGWEIYRPAAPQMTARAPTAPAPVLSPVEGLIAKAPESALAPVSAPPAPVPEAGPAAESSEKAPPEAPAGKRRARSTAAVPEPSTELRTGIQIKRTQPETGVNPLLTAAYEAFNAGDLPRAEQGYVQLLATEPGSRDALLGLAVIAQKRNRGDEAGRYYVRLLELDPRDPQANAGLMSLRTQGDPRQAESRLKMLIAQQPDSAVLYFALGNLYAGESRWAEAQQAYFRAVSAEPANADYAFNLAVSLDRLNQGKLAADYYRRSLALASSGAASFDRQRASGRLRELEQ